MRRGRWGDFKTGIRCPAAGKRGRGWVGSNAGGGREGWTKDGGQGQKVLRRQRGTGTNRCEGTRGGGGSDSERPQSVSGRLPPSHDPLGLEGGAKGDTPRNAGSDLGKGRTTEDPKVDYLKESDRVGRVGTGPESARRGVEKEGTWGREQKRVKVQDRGKESEDRWVGVRGKVLGW